MQIIYMLVLTLTKKLIIYFFAQRYRTVEAIARTFQFIQCKNT